MTNTKKQEKTVMLDALNKLQQDLRALGPIPYDVERKKVFSMWHGGEVEVDVPRDNAIFDYAVKFFSIIAQFQDSEVFKSDLFPENKTVKNLAALINDSGRSDYGIVRSKKGQPITKDNLWLSYTMYGTNTLCMAAWEDAWAKQPKYEEFYKSVYQLWMYQFMKERIDKMLPLCDELLQQKGMFQKAKNKMNQIAMFVRGNVMANKR